MKSERISPFWVGGYHPFSATESGNSSVHAVFGCIQCFHHIRSIFGCLLNFLNVIVQVAYGLFKELKFIVKVSLLFLDFFLFVDFFDKIRDGEKMRSFITETPLV